MGDLYKMKNIANIITQILTYSDTTGTTDNPQLRNFDWNRRLSSISIDNPYHAEIDIPPDGEVVLFDGLRSNSLDVTSVVDVVNIDTSNYKLKISAGSLSGWRTSRAITSLTDVNITINNDSVASFEFVGATLSGVVFGDILRVSGDQYFDDGPYDFNSINAGLWSVIAVSGDIVQAVRPTGQSFSGAPDAVVGTSSSQIQIYSSAGVQKDDKFELKSPFSVASHKVFAVKDVTPDTIFFVSTQPIPEESVPYPDPTPNGHSLFVYAASKKIFYLETDQEVSVRFDDDEGDNVKVCPIEPGNPDLIGYFHKYGPCYKAVIKNRSVNVSKILYFVAE